MRPVRTLVGALSIVLLGTSYALGQATVAPGGVPRLIGVNGVFTPADGGRPAAVEAVTVAIYDSETGGTPIWQETQSIELQPDGRYTIVVGVAHGDGIPAEVFASPQERWVGTLFARACEQRPLRPARVRRGHAGRPAGLGVRAGSGRQGERPLGAKCHPRR